MSLQFSCALHLACNLAADTAMEAIGAIGFAFQVVDITIQAVDLWCRSNEVGEDVVFIQARLDMIRARLKTWEIEWDFQSNKHLEDEKFRKYGDLALKYLLIIQHRLTSMDNFHQKFPSLFKPDPKGTKSNAVKRTVEVAGIQDIDDDSLRKMEENIRDINKGNVVERWRWARKEGRGLRMVEQVATLVSDLEDFFEPPFRDPNANIVFNQMLASKGAAAITSLPKDLKETIDEGTVPLLSGLAMLKTELEKRADSSRTREMFKPPRLLKERRRLNTEGGARETAHLQGRNQPDPVPVLIEWKVISSSLSKSDQDTLSERIQDLAQLLHTEGKPDELHTLDCVGIVEIQGSDGQDLQLGLLFRMPQKSKVFTLADLLADGLPVSLTAKFVLAKVLAKALLFLHLASWMHKGIRSDNILFFADQVTEVDLAQPYLAGFEYSRLNTPDAYTQNVDNNFENNLYRHPEHQGVPSVESPSTKANPRKHFTFGADYYSLGVVLLELGHWKSALAMTKDEGIDGAFEMATEGRDIFLKNLAGLQNKMGDAYTNIVSRCIKGEFPVASDQSSHTAQESFYLNAVRPMEQCHV